MLNSRDPVGLAAEDYDLAIVGGGIHGIMVLLEAARRGLRGLLVERGDFGAGTSHNSLRIAHGGLRYLQTGDLRRFRESVAERAWLLRHFPDLVEPLPCLMPLYGDGLRRPAVLRAALAINDFLSRGRNAGLDTERALPDGRLLSAEETLAALSDIEPKDLQGAALWYDAFIPNAPRLLIEALRWACARGGRALNYVEARGLLQAEDRVTGLRAVDLASGSTLEFRSKIVINAAGPWAPNFAAACGAPHDGLFAPSLAWNLVFQRKPPSVHALAVRPRRPDGQVYFLVPWKGALLAGTGHAPWTAGPDGPTLSPEALSGFIASLNEAYPALELREEQVSRVFLGLLPAIGPGTAALAAREIILDHGAQGKPRGFYSISGIKLTTGRLVADKVLKRAFPGARARPYAQFGRPVPEQGPPDYPFSWTPDPADESWKQPLSGLIESEAVQHLDDLLLRRTSLGDNPTRALALAPEAAGLFEWDEPVSKTEIEKVRQSCRAFTLQDGGI